MEGTAAPRTEISRLPDLTGQIFGKIDNYVAAGGFGSVYQCDWIRPTSSPVKVAVKVIRCPTSEQDKVILRRLRREAGIWAYLVHENIVPLYGTTKDFGPFPALVSLWFSHGTLHRLIADKGTSLSTRSKLNLLHDIACGLNYLHSFPIVHGDLTSSNVLVDVRGGEYKACLTDFGLSTVLGGLLNDPTVEASTVRYGALRWTAPELLRYPADGVKPTEQNDMYSFGRVMFHVLTLLIPWNNLDHFQVLQKLNNGEEIERPQMLRTTSDLTDTRWNEIELCWSADTSARPSASMAMTFLMSELLSLTDDDVPVGREQESRQSVSLGMGPRDIVGTAPPRASSPTAIELENTSPPYGYIPQEMDEWTLLSSSSASGLQPQADWTTTPPIPQSFSKSVQSQLKSPSTHVRSPSSQLNSSSTPVQSPDQPPVQPPSQLHNLSTPVQSPGSPDSHSTLVESSSSYNSLSTPVPLPSQVDNSNPVSIHPSATVSSLSVSGPLNVLIFGETGVGKSSVINLILGKDLAQTSADAPTCTLEHTPYAISLENRQFKLWEVSSIASMNFFRRLFMKWNMKRKYKKLFKADGVYLLLYCMRNSRAQGTLVKDYNFFTSIVGSSAGRVPVAAVVTCLEDYVSDMDDWWKKNEDNLKKNGMQFSKHACITSLPYDPTASDTLRTRRQRSQQIIRGLLCDSYQWSKSTSAIRVPIS